MQQFISGSTKNYIFQNRNKPETGLSEELNLPFDPDYKPLLFSLFIFAVSIW